MRIAFFCKRQYMGKDVILDRYARLYEIPFQLAMRGHDVLGNCLSYHGKDDQGSWSHGVAGQGHLRWESQSVGRFKALRVAAYPLHLLGQMRLFKPDVLIGASDIPHAVLTAWLAKKLRIPYAIDLYDNFEGFGQARIPGFVPALRWAVRNANLTITTSELLRAFVQECYFARGQVLSMPSTIDKTVFHPMNKLDCRRLLGLPENAKLIGTAGGLLATRGIGTLYEAWRILAMQDPQIHLVLAGPTDQDCPPPNDSRVHYLGMLAHNQTSVLFNSLDVGVIYLRDTLFGRYCFPQKAYEMMACHLPVAATNVGAMQELLAEFPSNLYSEDDPESLVDALVSQLTKQTRPKQHVPDWTESVSKMATIIEGPKFGSSALNQ